MRLVSLVPTFLLTLFLAAPASAAVTAVGCVEGSTGAGPFTPLADDFEAPTLNTDLWTYYYGIYGGYSSGFLDGGLFLDSGLTSQAENNKFIGITTLPQFAANQFDIYIQAEVLTGSTGSLYGFGANVSLGDSFGGTHISVVVGRGWNGEDIDSAHIAVRSSELDIFVVEPFYAPVPLVLDQPFTIHYHYDNGAWTVTIPELGFTRTFDYLLPDASVRGFGLSMGASAGRGWDPVLQMQSDSHAVARVLDVQTTLQNSSYIVTAPPLENNGVAYDGSFEGGTGAAYFVSRDPRGTFVGQVDQGTNIFFFDGSVNVHAYLVNYTGFLFTVYSPLPASDILALFPAGLVVDATQNNVLLSNGGGNAMTWNLTCNPPNPFLGPLSAAQDLYNLIAASGLHATPALKKLSFAIAELTTASEAYTAGDLAAAQISLDAGLAEIDNYFHMVLSDLNGPKPKPDYQVWFDLGVSVQAALLAITL